MILYRVVNLMDRIDEQEVTHIRIPVENRSDKRRLFAIACGVAFGRTYWVNVRCSQDQILGLEVTEQR